MPQDPNLYGQRPMKKQKHDTKLSTSLDFTAQLTSLMSNAKSSEPTATRSRQGKQANKDLFTGKPKKQGDKEDDGKLVLKDVVGTEDEAVERERARRKMEVKARLYAAMKRGDYVPKDSEAAPLVDFDRKWAENAEEKEGQSTSSSDDDESDQGAEMVEYEDEFGRVRQVSKAEKEKLDRRVKRGLLGAEELERMSARPLAPEKLIVGDTVQSMAFNPDDFDKMEELARKRDRSATPPELKHYDADWEIRSKGVGFFKFSKDEETRTQEMKNLEEERKRTEEQRKERDAQKETRRLEIEQRRKDMANRRAKRQADSFLDGLTDK